ERVTTRLALQVFDRTVQQSDPAKYILSKGEGTPSAQRNPNPPFIPLWQRGKRGGFEEPRRTLSPFDVAQDMLSPTLFRTKYNVKFQMPSAETFSRANYKGARSCPTRSCAATDPRRRRS